MKTPIELAADAVPEKVERPLIERLSGVMRDYVAWRELDSIPVPKTTFVDRNGLPMRSIVLGTGENIYPSPDPRGEIRTAEDPYGVDDNLNPLQTVGTVIWSGSIPSEMRNPELRSEREELHINRGYDEAVTRESDTPEAGPLTEREWEVIELLVKRQSDSAMAAKLGVRPVTIRTFIWNITRKLEVKGREGIVRWAQTSEEEEARTRRDERRKAPGDSESGERQAA